MASFMPPAYIRSVRGSQGADLKTPVGKSWAEEQLGGAPSNGPNGAPKCQRPRTTGARTSGAAELFSGRPSAGAMKHRRRRWMQDRDDRDVSQGVPISPMRSVYCGTSRTTGPLTGGGPG